MKHATNPASLTQNPVSILARAAPPSGHGRRNRAIRCLLLAALFGLSGCDTWSRYRPLPAGGYDAIWRPEGVPQIDLEQQVANKADLQHGNGADQVDAGTAAAAVNRARTGRTLPLLDSKTSKIGGAGGQGGSTTTQGGQ